jgi:hypothetical protein
MMKKFLTCAIGNGQPLARAVLAVSTLVGLSSSFGILLHFSYQVDCDKQIRV